MAGYLSILRKNLGKTEHLTYYGFMSKSADRFWHEFDFTITDYKFTEICIIFSE